jgi:hypothetical protein
MSVVAEYVGGRTVSHARVEDINVLDEDLIAVTAHSSDFAVAGRYRECSMEEYGVSEMHGYIEYTYTCHALCGSWYCIRRYDNPVVPTAPHVMYILGPYTECCSGHVQMPEGIFMPSNIRTVNVPTATL